MSLKNFRLTDFRRFFAASRNNFSTLFSVEKRPKKRPKNTHFVVVYDQFKMNYNMHSMEKTLTELRGMLKQAEQTLKDEGKHDMLMIKKGKPFKRAGKKKKGFKGKGKKNFPPKPKATKDNKEKKVASSKSDSECFYCK